MGIVTTAPRRFNPRSPWGERQSILARPRCGCLFQSTLPVGGATLTFGYADGVLDSFNPRSPWGERHTHIRAVIGGVVFQSTLPVGGATKFALI